MEQRRRRQPRHERGILDRIPEPPAAPAQFIIGPIAARCDPQRQEYPRAEHPRPHRPGKGGANIARNQRPHCKAERDRHPDIAKIERWRMEGEAGVLQQRIEPLPIHGHG